MIQAVAQELPLNDFMLEISYPGEKKKPVYKYVINRKEANIVVYAYYRDYIFEKLNNWLTQRAYGLQWVDPHRAQLADHLRILLGVFKMGTLQNICKHVAAHRDDYAFLAPSKRSPRQYKHFTDRVTPVLNLCDELGGKA